MLRHDKKMNSDTCKVRQRRQIKHDVQKNKFLKTTATKDEKIKIVFRAGHT